MDFARVTQMLCDEGVAHVGYADLTGVLPTRYAALPRAMVLVWRLCDGVLDEVAADGAPTFSYFHHYRAVNATLDRLTLRVATQL